MTSLQPFQEGSVPVLDGPPARCGQRGACLAEVIGRDAESGTQAGPTHISAVSRVLANVQGGVSADITTSEAASHISNDGSTTFQLHSAEVDGGPLALAQPALRPLDPLDHQHVPAAATPLQGAIALSTEDTDTRLEILLVKEEREYGGLRNGFHMMRTHYPERFEGFVATMGIIAVGTGGGISFSNSRPVAVDVLILAFILWGRYLAALADEGIPKDENDDVLPAVFFRSASKMVGAGAETTAREVLAACNVRDPEQVALLKKRMDTLEFEVSSRLKWMLNAATPTEFIHLFLSRAVAVGVLGEAHSCSAKETATTTAFEWVRRGLLADFKPSELASAAVYLAVLYERDPTTARNVTEVSGSDVPDLLENARFSVLIPDTERLSPPLYSPELTMPQAVDTGRGAGVWNGVDYDTEEPTPPSTAGSANAFFQDDQAANNDNGVSSLNPDGESDAANSWPEDWDSVFDHDNNFARTGNPEDTGDSSDGTSMTASTAETSLAPIGQGSLAEENTIPPIDEGEQAGKWFGSSLFLPSAMTALAMNIENAAAAPGAVDSAHHPTTPGTRRIDSNAVFENGYQNAGSDGELIGWVKGFLSSGAAEGSAEPETAAKMRPVWPNEGMVCSAIDVDVSAGSSSDGSALGPDSVDDTMPHIDVDNSSTSNASGESSQSWPQHGPLLVPSAVVIDRGSREAACQTNPTPRTDDIEASWERAAWRRLDEGVDAYRRQQQESSMVRWGPGGLLVPAASVA